MKVYLFVLAITESIQSSILHNISIRKKKKRNTDEHHDTTQPLFTHYYTVDYKMAGYARENTILHVLKNTKNASTNNSKRSQTNNTCKNTKPIYHIPETATKRNTQSMYKYLKGKKKRYRMPICHQHFQWKR